MNNFNEILKWLIKSVKVDIQRIINREVLSKMSDKVTDTNELKNFKYCLTKWKYLFALLNDYNNICAIRYFTISYIFIIMKRTSSFYT